LSIIQVKIHEQPVESRLVSTTTACILHTLAAAVGCVMTAAVLIQIIFQVVHRIDPTATKGPYYSLLFNSYFPLQIAIGLLAGYVNSVRFKNPIAMWVWVLPAVAVARAIFAWHGYSVTENYWMAVFHHFFWRECHLPLTRSCAEQFLLIAPFYASIAYSLGTLAERQKFRFQWKPTET